MRIQQIISSTTGSRCSASLVACPNSYFSRNRQLSAPGAELVLPVVAPRPVLNVGRKLGSWLTSAGIYSPRAGELWNAHSWLSDGQTRQAFLRTLRSVVDILDSFIATPAPNTDLPNRES